MYEGNEGGRLRVEKKCEQFIEIEWKQERLRMFLSESRVPFHESSLKGGESRIEKLGFSLYRPDGDCGCLKPTEAYWSAFWNKEETDPAHIYIYEEIKQQKVQFNGIPFV